MPRFSNLLALLPVVIGLTVATSDLSIFRDSNSLAWKFFEYAYEYKNDNNNNITIECSTQFDVIMQALLHDNEIAYKYVDAWGRFPSGILFGHYLEMGNFDECLSINGDLPKSQYCLSAWPLAELTLKIGLCLPESCAVGELNSMLKAFINTTYGLRVDEAFDVVVEGKCQTQEGEDLKALDWVAIGILIVLATFLILSSVYDCYAQKVNKLAHPLWVAFSLPANLQQLFKITPKTSNANVIPCLHGIRCLSLIWIIFIHCYLLAKLSPNINNVAVNEWYESPFSMFYQSGTIAVDTFFFLSGLLVIVVAFREMSRNSGQMKVLSMYAHRYLRLTPVLALAVLIFMTIYRFMGSGPVWNSFIASSQLCEETWWQTLIYVQNYAAAGKMCLGHSWYLAVDTQFYVLSPLVLYVIWKWHKKGLIAVGLVGLLLSAIIFAIIIVDDLSVFATTRNNGADNGEMRKIYYATHARAAPWIIGILFGYYLYANNGRKVVLRKRLVAVFWLLAILMFLTVIFALYPKTLATATDLTAVEGAFYLVLSRIGWPLALCWLVFACVNDYGGPINWMLSWSIWQPLSKLSYCMYIWHLLVVTANAGRTKTNTYFGDYNVILSFWSNFGITLIVSTLMYVLIEAPMLGVEKVILPNRRKVLARPQNAAEQPSAGNVNQAATISQECLCDVSKT